jgi:hypothetical protein
LFKGAALKQTVHLFSIVNQGQNVAAKDREVMLKSSNPSNASANGSTVAIPKLLHVG